MDSAPFPAYTSDAKLWFTQLYLYFAAKGVQFSRQQMHILIIGIPVSLTDTVKGLINDTPQGTSYDSLKSDILIQNSKPTESRFRTPLQDKHLGDKTSEF